MMCDITLFFANLAVDLRPLFVARSQPLRITQKEQIVTRRVYGVRVPISLGLRRRRSNLHSFSAVRRMLTVSSGRI